MLGFSKYVCIQLSKYVRVRSSSRNSKSYLMFLDYGCSGGWWPTVWDDVKTNDYIALMEDYSYVGESE